MIKVKEILWNIDNLSLAFGNNVIFSNISFTINNLLDTNTVNPKGQIISVFGKSGIGKTQMCRIIAGLKKPTSGSVSYAKYDRKEDGDWKSREWISPKAGDVGFVFQNYPLFAHRTVLGNLMLVSKDKEKIEYFLALFGVLGIASKYPSQISGGQRQRIAIIQQLLHNPFTHTFILDEPFSGLDPAMTEKVAQTIRTIADLDDRNTVLIISHDIERTVAIADESIVMYEKQGKVNAICLMSINSTVENVRGIMINGK